MSKQITIDEDRLNQILSSVYGVAIAEWNKADLTPEEIELINANASVCASEEIELIKTSQAAIAAKLKQ